MKKTSIRLQFRHLLFGLAIDFLQLFVAMFITEVFLSTPAFGGALFVAGQFWTIYYRLYRKNSRKTLPKAIRNKSVWVLLLSLLPCIALIVIYPRMAPTQQVLHSFVLVSLLFIREILTETISRKLLTNSLRRVFNISAHILILALWYALLSVGESTSEKIPILAGLAITGGMLVLDQWNRRDDVFAAPPESRQGQDYSGVRAYNIYNKMVNNILIAVNLTLLSYIFYLKYLPYRGFLESLLGLMLWLSFVAGITALFMLLLNRKRRWRYEKATLFAVGVVLWLSSIWLVSSGRISPSGISALFLWALFGLSLACLLSIIVSMGIEIRNVMELALGERDEQVYAYNTGIMVSWSMLMSNLLIMIIFTLASFLMNGMLNDKLDNLPILPELLQTILMALPLVFVVVSMIYLVLQPLDKEYVEKLRIYRAKRSRGELGEALENQLKHVLVAKYPRRIGIRLAKAVVRPFFPLKIIGRENVKKEQLPVVFVCNHYELYGPLAAVLRLPYYFRPWIINDAVDRELIEQKLYQELRRMKPKWPEKLIRGLGKMISPLAAWIIKSQNPIAVHRNSRGIVQTMNETVEALECNDNILIFPENPMEDGVKVGFQTDGVGNFFTGFSGIGRLYFKKTGLCAAFVPIYINREEKTLRIGEAVVFDETAHKNEEKQRIAQTLQSKMQALSVL